MNTKNCTSCGAAVPANALFCTSCGTKVNASAVDSAPQAVQQNAAPQPVAPVQQPNPVYAAQRPVYNPQAVRPQPPKAPSKITKTGLITLIRNCVVMLMALLMVIFAFMPVTTFESNEEIIEDGPNMAIDISPVRAVSLFISSMKSMDEDDVNDEYDDVMDELKDKYEDSLDEFYDADDWDDLKSNEQSDIINYVDQVLYEELRLMLSLEDTSVPPQVFFAGIASIAYIALAIALLIVAAFNTFATFNLIKSPKGSLWKWTVKLITLVPALLLLLNYLYAITYKQGSSHITNTHLSVTAIVTLVCGFIAIASSAVLRLIFTNQRSISTLVKRGVALVIAIVVIALAGAPIISTTAKIEPENMSKKKEFSFSVDADIFVGMGFNEEDTWDYIDNKYTDPTRTEKKEIFEDRLNHFSLYTKKEIENGDADYINTELVVMLYYMYVGETMMVAPYIMILQIIALLGAVFVMWQMLQYFAYGSYSRGFTLAGKLLGLIAGVLYTIIISALVVMAMLAADSYAPSAFTLTIGLGLLAFGIFCIALLAMPLSPRKHDESNYIPVHCFTEVNGGAPAAAPTVAPAATAPAYNTGFDVNSFDFSALSMFSAPTEAPTETNEAPAEAPVETPVETPTEAPTETGNDTTENA
ncbi:MAG: hypothetical protein IJX51_00655 [Clostridia bacterium]|nr:hypothetical protein [Clostridia bacterium]